MSVGVTIVESFRRTSALAASFFWSCLDRLRLFLSKGQRIFRFGEVQEGQGSHDSALGQMAVEPANFFTGFHLKARPGALLGYLNDEILLLVFIDQCKAADASFRRLLLDEARKCSGVNGFYLD